MDDYNTFNKLQWSKFNADHSEQVVVRCNTTEEADALIEWAKKSLTDEGFPNDHGATVTDPKEGVTANPCCELHPAVPMTLRPPGVSTKTGRPYPAFYSCSVVLPNGAYCKGKPKKD